MRLSLWLILILAFSVGMCCALVVRSYYFEAAPVVAQITEPTTKILVAMRTIPSGVEITADFVAFQEVPLSKVPTGSFHSFSQVYRRQPAYPLPADCPICEDLLLPVAVNTAETTFVPTGSQIVTLDVARIRQGDKVFSPKEPVSAMLATNQRIDIRIVPHETQGKLAEKRNEVIRAFASPQDIQNSGELILENVPILRIQRQIVADQTGSVRDSLKLMLDTNDAARLTTAARKGQIRIFVHSDENNIPQPAEDKNNVEIADSSSLTLHNSVLLEQPPLLDLPYVQDRLSSVPAESDQTVAEEHVQRTAPVPADIIKPMPLPVSTVVPSPRTMLPLVHDESIPSIDMQPSDLAVSPTPESEGEETDAIRNDGVVTFGTLPFRNISSAPAPVLEQNPIAMQLSSSPGEPGRDLPVRPSIPPEPAMGSPRIANTIQFLPPHPGGIVLAREYPQTRARQMEIAQMPPPMPLVMPTVISVPTLTQERVPGGYSPWERRAYTVLPNEELLTPQPLLRSSDTGTQTQ